MTRPPELAWLIARPIAHRGFHNAAAGIPENTIAAAEEAIRRGLPIECDVQLTVDGEAVVFHDERLERLTGVAGEVRTTTLAAMRALRVLGTDQAPPSLREFLDFIAGRVPVLIEIKSHGRPGPLEAAVLGELRLYRGRAAIMSFATATVRWFRVHAPDITRGQISGSYRNARELGALTRFARRHLLMLPFSRPHVVAHEINCLGLLACRLWRRFGGPLLTWTARTPAAFAEASRRADAVIFEGFEPPR